LIDVVEGRCDAAMSSASLETAAKAALTAGKEIDVATLEMQVAATDEIVFVIHPANPVRRLTWEQIRDIHTGKITSWKEVGGQDLPIVIFTDAAASATRSMIQDRLLGGKEYSPKANALGTVRQVGDLVAITEGGIGGLGLGFVDPAKVRVVESEKLERPLGFVTVGPPSGKIRQVIEAYRAQAKP
jgi:phosphate transport system substrate-binding protein